MAQIGTNQTRTDVADPAPAKGHARASDVIRRCSNAGPTVPDYDLLRRIARGAYGEVWLARSNATGIFRAAKLVWRHTFEDDRPFQREFEGIQRFERVSREHPSQLALFHIGRNDAEGYFYYVMELADEVEVRDSKSEVHIPPSRSNSDPGSLAEYAPHTLRADLVRGRLTASRALEVGLALAEALVHLHRNGLVHRDVKPSNVIFVNGRPKLADIGLVTDASDECSVVGTEGYLPPEGPGTVQADLFALGKVLYEAVTGMDRRDFPKLPEDLRSWRDARMVFELNEIILKACASNSADRYRTAEAMHAELTRLLQGKSLSSKRRVERLGRLVRRWGGWAAAAAAVVLWTTLVSRARHPADASLAARGSANQLANYYYNLGRYYLEKPTEKHWAHAADYFRRATEADPQFAQAYASLALTEIWRMGEDPINLAAGAKTSALKALALDNSLPEAHIALGWYKVTREWAWKDAEREFRQAMRLSPKNPECYHFYAEWLRMSGRTNEAIEAMREAVTLDQRSVRLNMRLADHYVGARRFQAAIDQAEYVTSMEPDGPILARVFQIRALLGMARFEEAINALEQVQKLSGKPPAQAERWSQELKAALAARGAQGFWQRVVEASLKANESPYWQAGAYSQLGQTNDALASLEKARDQRDLWLTFYVMNDWTLDPVRSEPRFHSVLQSMRLE